MKHFEYLQSLNEIFYINPCEYKLNSSRDILVYSIGALLYTSALREDLLNSLINLRFQNCNSVAICLEDATDSNNILNAEKNVFKFFKEVHRLQKKDNTFIERNLPLIFLRVKNPQQLKKILENYPLDCLCGFIVPKISIDNCNLYFPLVDDFNKANNKKLFVLPVLESKSIAYKETRLEELIKLKNYFDKYKDLILNIRIGATDLSGILGIRRNKEHTIYDVGVVSDCIYDIINVFKRDEYVISGPVYEYFNNSKIFQPSTFIKEIKLDITNGLTGKTVIHPKQVFSVNASLVVSKEEYSDAIDIVTSNEDGVIRSTYRNKMNEIKPHTIWATNILKRAKIMGVYNYGKDYKDLLKWTSQTSERSFRNKTGY
ncbi:HpcH/HpaI aldolase/citrate lyase family protein [Oceanirhabdus seepicola]|uniref:HpcH/HpaI aldolase/citrate lyase family protein n=1 Tax=Oceanirhabdus seepicola TaxID=2828781 RepID=A0A9J6NWL1_9CLOT|nr:HpcH/HpaI aldolase/citrate lyase family protein [Oceanirhabdus seepicola]MCM1988289.1 HpcH/HpaI aldolase/citrate lyase family protein [Oceanirhabdus seepicola]